MRVIFWKIFCFYFIYSYDIYGQSGEYNLDFEWITQDNLPHLWIKNESGITFCADSSLAYSGKYSLKAIPGKNPVFAQCFQKLVIQPGKLLKVSGFVRGNGYLALNIDGKIYSSEINPNQEKQFVRHTLEVALKPSCQSITLLCVAEGFACFDALDIFADGQPYGIGADKLPSAIDSIFRYQTKPLEDCFNGNDCFSSIGQYHIVGLGEGGHGAQEYKQWQSALTQHWISRHLVDALLIEANYFEMLGINKYLEGRGSLDVVKSDLKYWIHRHAPLFDFLVWLKRYNQENCRQFKVIGYDVKRKMPLNHPLIADLANFPDLSSSFIELLSEVPDWDEGSKLRKQKPGKWLHRLNRIHQQLDSTLVKKYELDLWMLRQYLRLLDSPNPSTRSALLLENTNHLLREFPRMVVWAHNGHIAELKSFYGDQLYACATLGGAGKVLVKNSFGALMNISLEAGFPGTVEYALNQQFADPVVLPGSTKWKGFLKTAITRNIGSVKPDNEFIRVDTAFTCFDAYFFFPIIHPIQILD